VADTLSIEQEMARIVVRTVAAGKTVEIEGLGAFHPDPTDGIRFEPQVRPTVFIAHVQEDSVAASRIYDALEAAGCSPWMD